MSDIIVSAVEHAACAEYAEPGHRWVVEGDFGFLGSYMTFPEALEAARIDAEAAGASILHNE